MNISFEGKTAVVTGAGKGIGRALSLALAKGGAKVHALSRTQADLDSLKEENADVMTYLVDMTDSGRVEEVFCQIGPVELLVNNAAIAQLCPFLEGTLEDFNTSFAVNVRQVMHASQIAARAMVERGDAAKRGCSIVNVSSQASAVALENHATYCATKAALDSYTRAMALELGAKGIRVNSVQPTVVMTAMAMVGWSDPEKAAKMTSQIPLGRFAEVHEVVDVIMFLLSDKAAMLNGVHLPIDGGFLAC